MLNKDTHAKMAATLLVLHNSCRFRRYLNLLSTTSKGMKISAAVGNAVKNIARARHKER